ncbi:MAG: hypothetical protein ACOX0T_08910 [Pelotomaculum sp.]
MNLGLFLLQGIPEMTGLVGLSLALAGIPLRWGRIIAAGTVLALFLYFVRLLPITFGLHTIAGILLLFFLIIRATNIQPSKALIAVFGSLVIIAVLELTLQEAFFSITKFNRDEIIANSPYWLGLGLLQGILMIFFAFIAARFKQPQKGVWKF